MHGGAKTRFLNFEGTEQGNTTSFSADLDLLVPLDRVFDGCNKSLVGNRLRHLIVNTHLSACPDQHFIRQPTEEDKRHFMQAVVLKKFPVVKYLENTGVTSTCPPVGWAGPAGGLQ
jgi:hypothetical protein